MKKTQKHQIYKQQFPWSIKWCQTCWPMKGQPNQTPCMQAGSAMWQNVAEAHFSDRLSHPRPQKRIQASTIRLIPPPLWGPDPTPPRFSHHTETLLKVRGAAKSLQCPLHFPACLQLSQCWQHAESSLGNKACGAASAQSCTLSQNGYGTTLKITKSDSEAKYGSSSSHGALSSSSS